jgi:hypothetical protein
MPPADLQATDALADPHAIAVASFLIESIKTAL